MELRCVGVRHLHFSSLQKKATVVVETSEIILFSQCQPF